MRRLTAALAALALLILPACAQQASAQERIAQAPAATLEAGTARMSMDMSVTGGQQDFSMTGEGAIDFDSEQATMTLDLGELGAQTGMDSLEMVTEGTTIYMKLPNAAQMGLPTDWVKMDIEDMEGMQGFSDLQQMSNDPAKSMEMLRGVSEDVTEVGSEEVRGISTTHYTATIDLEKAAEEVPSEFAETMRQQIKTLGSKTLPIDAWIDDEGRMVRQRFTMDLSKIDKAAGGDGGGGAQGEMTMTMEMFDFGAEVDVAPPPDSDVTDFKDLQGAGG